MPRACALGPVLRACSFRAVRSPPDAARPPAPPTRPCLRPWQERVSTLRADVQAGPAVQEPASTTASRPASTPNALPPPQARRPAQAQQESTAAPAPPPPPEHEYLDDCPAIYLTSLGGDDEAPPMWEPPPAPWGASLAGLPTWDDVQLQ